MLTAKKVKKVKNQWHCAGAEGAEEYVHQHLGPRQIPYPAFSCRIRAWRRIVRFVHAGHRRMSQLPHYEARTTSRWGCVRLVTPRAPLLETQSVSMFIALWHGRGTWSDGLESVSQRIDLGSSRAQETLSTKKWFLRRLDFPLIVFNRENKYRG